MRYPKVSLKGYTPLYPLGQVQAATHKGIAILDAVDNTVNGFSEKSLTVLLCG